jgi:hypothetical protein
MAQRRRENRLGLVLSFGLQQQQAEGSGRTGSAMSVHRITASNRYGFFMAYIADTPSNLLSSLTF